MGISGFRQLCEHLRRCTRSLNPLACALLIPPDAIYQRPHRYARLRISNIGGATDLLSATVHPEPALEQAGVVPELPDRFLRRPLLVATGRFEEAQ